MASFWQLDGTSHLGVYGRDKVEEVALAVQEMSACVRCFMRCINIREAQVYQEDIKDMRTVFSLPDKKFVCVLCLEILQDKFCCDGFLQEVRKLVVDQNFKFNDFFCALSVPVSQLIREHRFSARLNDMFPEVFEWPDVKKDMTPLKDVWKWINGTKLAAFLKAPFNQRGDFEVQIFFKYADDDKECNDLIDLLGKDQRKRKKMNVFFNRMNMTQMLDKAHLEFFKEGVSGVREGCVLEIVECVHQAVFVAGRYNKYSRELSQTPWFINGVRKHESSVEEIINAPIEAVFRARSSKFSSSGREDVDVRMLGRGRPFVLEVIQPSLIQVDRDVMRKIQDEINSGQEMVKVRDLQMVTKEEVKELNRGEEENEKMYRALCVVRGGEVSVEAIRKINDIPSIELKQQTPIRVLHRRVLATRPRMLYKIKVEVVDRFGGGKKRRYEDFEKYFEVASGQDGGSGDQGGVELKKEGFVGHDDNKNNKNDDKCDIINENNNKYGDNNNNNIINNNKDVTIKIENNMNDPQITLLMLDLLTQAGTYIKEFVHGDFSRTLPNLRTLLGVECDILLLDVVNVKCLWPPSPQL